ncbi:unnamed protein product [Lampetra planeri]
MTQAAPGDKSSHGGGGGGFVTAASDAAALRRQWGLLESDRGPTCERVKLTGGDRGCRLQDAEGRSRARTAISPRHSSPQRPPMLQPCPARARWLVPAGSLSSRARGERGGRLATLSRVVRSRGVTRIPDDDAIDFRSR